MAAATPAAALPDDLLEEIFLRLPPDEPASLLRASLISKAWGGAISSPAFRRRLHEFHRTPPVLGFLHDWDDERIPRFVPTTASSFYLAAPDSRTWQALDCRHGRALFISSEDQGELLVWEPIPGTQRRVPLPALIQTFREYAEESCSCAAVFCAADGCDHRDCHGNPFGLLFVFTTNSTMLHPDDEEEEEGFHIWASVFSSETGTWSEVTLLGHSVSPLDFSLYSSVLVGRSLLYFMSVGDLILEYDLATESMTVLYKPSSAGRFNIMLTKDGGLGVAEYSNLNLKLWTRDNTDAHWLLSRVINLVNLLPVAALVDADSRVQVLGFAEGTNTIFLNTAAGIFKVELQPEKARKVCDRHGLGNLIPVVSFFTPVPRGEHQDPPLLGPSEEAGGEAGGEKEKAIEQPQQLFDKGSNDIEEVDLVKSRSSHALKTRIPSHGEIALECASTALLHQGKEMNDHLDDVSRSASNEESVTVTTSKDGAGNSKTSGSNVEDATPSEKVLRG